jgi:hypothetical protein
MKKLAGSETTGKRMERNPPWRGGGIAKAQQAKSSATPPGWVDRDDVNPVAVATG